MMDDKKVNFLKVLVALYDEGLPLLHEYFEFTCMRQGFNDVHAVLQKNFHSLFDFWKSPKCPACACGWQCKRKGAPIITSEQWSLMFMKNTQSTCQYTPNTNLVVKDMDITLTAFLLTNFMFCEGYYQQLPDVQTFLGQYLHQVRDPLCINTVCPCGFEGKRESFSQFILYYEPESTHPCQFKPRSTVGSLDQNVITEFLRILRPFEKVEIYSIRDMRNKFAHSKDIELQHSEFEDEWNKLIFSVEVISRSISPQRALHYRQKLDKLKQENFFDCHTVIQLTEKVERLLSRYQNALKTEQTVLEKVNNLREIIHEEERRIHNIEENVSMITQHISRLEDSEAETNISLSQQSSALEDLKTGNRELIKDISTHSYELIALHTQQNQMVDSLTMEYSEHTDLIMNLCSMHSLLQNRVLEQTKKIEKISQTQTELKEMYEVCVQHNEKNTEMKRKRIERARQTVLKQTSDKEFIQTTAYQEAMEILYTTNFLLITGRHGDGMTLTAYHCIKELMKGTHQHQVLMDPIIISSPTDFNNLVSADQNLAIFIDDFLGISIQDRRSIQDWVTHFDVIDSSISKKTRMNSNKLLLTIQKEVYNSTKPLLTKLPCLREDSIIDFTSIKCSLKPEEKTKLLNLFAGDSLSAEDKAYVVSRTSTIGFPKCCFLFQLSKIRGRSYFESPKKLIKYICSNLDNSSFLILAILSMRGGEIKRKDILQFSKDNEFYRSLSEICGVKFDSSFLNKISNALTALSGVYITYDALDDLYKFSHRGFLESMCSIMYKKNPICTLALTWIGFLNLISFKKSYVSIFIHENCYDQVVKRVSFEIRNNPSKEVFDLISKMDFWEAEAFVKMMSDDLQSCLLYISSDARLLFLNSVLENGNCILLVQILKLLGKKFQLPKGSSLLYLAAKSGSVDMLQIVLSINDDIKGMDNELIENALHTACQCGYKDIVCFLMDKYPSLSTHVDKGGNSLLHHVAGLGNLKLFKVLLERGLDPYSFNLKNESVLYTAASHGHFSLVSYIETTFSQLKYQLTTNGMTVLHAAIISGSIDCLDFLLAHIFDYVYMVCGNENFLELACRIGSLQMLRHMLEERTEFNEIMNRDSLLPFAAQNKSTDVLQYFLEKYCDSDYLEHENKTFIKFVCLSGNTENLQVGLERNKCHKHWIDENGWTLIHFGVLSGSMDVIRLLKTEGIDIDATIDEDHILLHLACYSLSIEMVQYVMANCSPTPLFSLTEDANKWTVLHSAVLSGSIAIVHLLIFGSLVPQSLNGDSEISKFMCNFKKQDMWNFHQFILQHPEQYPVSLLFCSVYSQNVEMLKYLIQNGLDIKMPTNSTITLFQAACGLQNLDMILFVLDYLPEIDEREQDSLIQKYESISSLIFFKKIIEKGFDVFRERQDGMTAFHFACLNQNSYVIKFLLQKYPNAMQIFLKRGRNLLYWSLEFASKHIIKYMIENKLDEQFDHPVKDKVCVLLHAAQSKKFEIIEFLMQTFVEYENEFYKHGQLFLNQAIKSDSKSAVGTLIGLISKSKLQHQTCTPNSCKNILSYLVMNYTNSYLNENCQYVSKYIQHILEYHPEFLNDIIENEPEMTLLHSCVSVGALDVVKYILGKNTYINYTTKDNITVLHCACMNHNSESIKFLMPMFKEMKHTIADNGWNILHFAAAYGSMDIIQYLVDDKEICVSQVTNENFNIIHCACLNDDVGVIQMLIEKFPYLKDDVAEKGFTVLHICAQLGHLSVLKYLIEYGYDINRKTDDGLTLFHLACVNEDASLLEYLVSKYYDMIKELGSDRISVLHFSAMNGNVDTIKCLLRFGFDSCLLTAYRQTIIHCACRNKNDGVLNFLMKTFPHLVDANVYGNINFLQHCALGGEIQALDLLIGMGYDPMEVADNSWSILHFACYAENKHIIKHLLQHYPKLMEIKTCDGSTFIHFVAEFGSVESMKYIIDKKINVQETNLKKKNILHFACHNKDDSMMKYLVEKFPELLTRRTSSDCNVLHIAAAVSSLDIVQLIIKKGVNINETAENNTHVIHYAVQNRRDKRVIRYLIENYPTVKHVVNNFQWNILHFAAVTGPLCTFKYLMTSACLSLYDKTGDEMNLLHCSCYNENIECITYLIEKYPDLQFEENINGCSLLHTACEQGSLDVVKYLLEQNFDCSKRTRYGMTALHCASMNKNTEVIKYLLPKFPSVVDCLTLSGCTLLHCSALKGTIQTIEYLIENGFNVNDITYDNFNLLHCACLNKNIDVLKLLIQRYPEMIYAYTADGRSLIHLAANTGSIEKLQFLSQFQFDYETKTNDGKNILHCACMEPSQSMIEFIIKEYPSLTRGVTGIGELALHFAAKHGSLDNVKFLISKGFDINRITKDGQTTLHYACFNNDENVLQYITSICRNMIHTVDKNGYSLLHIVAEHGSLNMLKYLIQLGLDTKILTKDGRSILFCACLNREDNCFRFICQRMPELIRKTTHTGVSVLHVTAEKQSLINLKYLINLHITNFDCLTQSGLSILHYSCFRRDIETLKYLMDRYPLMKNSVTKHGFTILHYAANYSSLKSVIMLINNGLDVKKITNNGENILYLSCLNSNEDVIRYLTITYPELKHDVTKHGYSMLHAVAEHGSLQVMKFLIDQGLDVNKRTYGGKTILHCACFNKNPKMVYNLTKQFPGLKYLKDYGGSTLLHFAAEKGSVQMVQFLISQGLDVNATTSDGQNILHRSCINNDRYILRYLTEEYPHLKHEVDKKGSNMLHITAEWGSLDNFIYLLGHNLCIEQKTKTSRSVLHSACFNNDENVLRYLVTNFPDLLSIVTKNELTLLHLASEKCSLETVIYLIDRGLDVNKITKTGGSILYHSSLNKNKEILSYLIQTFSNMKNVLTNDGYSVLHVTAENGSLPTLLFLLQQGMDANQLTKTGRSVLFCSCFNDDENVFYYLVDNYPELIDNETDTKWTLLHIAAANRSLSVVQSLLNRGMDVNKVTTSGETVLHAACRNPRFDVVQFLTHNFTKLKNEIDNHGNNMLHYTAENGSLNILIFLLHNDVNVNQITYNGRTLHFSAGFNDDENMLQYLTEKYPNMVNKVTSDGYSVLHLAASKGKLHSLEFLLQKQLNPYIVTSEEQTILHQSCYSTNLEMIRNLMNSYPDMKYKVNIKGANLLHVAAEHSSLEVVQYFLKDGFSVSRLTNNNFNALHCAAFNSNDDVLRYLVKTYPDMIHSVTKTDLTILHLAAEHGSLEIMKYLIMYKSNIFSKNKVGETVFHRSCFNTKDEEIIKYLVKQYPEGKLVKDHYGQSILHISAWKQSLETLKFLIENEIDVLERTLAGRTVLHESCFNTNESVARYLMEKYPEMKEITDDYGNGILHFLIRGNHTKLFQSVISDGNRRKESSGSLNKLLKISCEQKNLEIMKILLEKYPTLQKHIAGKSGLPLLFSAVENNSIEIVSFLAQQGCNIRKLTCGYQSVLHCACLDGNIKIIEYLIKHFPDLMKMLDENGCNVLHYGVQSGSIDVFELLITCGIDECAETFDGKNILHCACLSGNINIVKHVYDMYPFMAEKCDKKGMSLIHCGAESGSKTVVQYLIEKGFNVNEITNDGTTVMDIACKHEHSELVKFLKKRYPHLQIQQQNDGWNICHFFMFILIIGYFTPFLGIAIVNILNW